MMTYLCKEIKCFFIGIFVLRYVVKGGANGGGERGVAAGGQHEADAHRRRVLQQRLAQLQRRTRQRRRRVDHYHLGHHTNLQHVLSRKYAVFHLQKNYHIPCNETSCASTHK